MTELGFPVSVVESMEEKGRWPDLSRLRARDPGKLKSCAWMLAHDVPVRDICEALSLSPCTVQAVADDPQLGVSVVSQKARVTTRMKLAFKLGIERVLADLSAGKKLPVFDLKLLHDMVQLADGGATSRVEHVHTLSHEEEELRQFMSQVTFTGASSGMGLEAGKTPAMPPILDVVEVEMAGAVGSVALAQPLTLNALEQDAASLVSKVPQSPAIFDQGGEGVGAPPPASS